MPVSLSILSIDFAAQGIASLGIEHLLFTRKVEIKKLASLC